MASVKIILRKKMSSDGTYPHVTRITQDRKTSIMSLGHSIPLKEWDSKEQRVKKSYSNSVRLNNLLSKRLSEARDKYIELQTNHTNASPRAVTASFKQSKEGTFFKQSILYIERQEQLENLTSYQQTTRTLSVSRIFKPCRYQFLGNHPLPITEI